MSTSPAVDDAHALRLGCAAAVIDEEVAPSIHDVLARIDREWGTCIALYMHGSSVFQNKPPADVDLLAVVDEPTKRQVFSASIDSQFKLGRFEVSVYTRSFWLQKLAFMDLTMLTCVSLPPEFILHEAEFFREETHSVIVRPQQLVESSRVYAEFTWIKARTLLEAREVHKSCKNVSYVFRVLELAAQILEYGRVDNFRAANQWWDRILDVYSSLPIGPRDWDMVEAMFAHSFQQQVSRVSHLAAPCRGAREEEGESKDVLVPESLDGLGRACALCSDPLPLAAEPTSCIVLPRCAHRLHLKCALSCCRAASAEATCPQCEAPWRLDLDKAFVFKRDAELRGTRQWLRASRQGRGEKTETSPVPTAQQTALARATLAYEAAQRAARLAREAAQPLKVLENVLAESALVMPASEGTLRLFYGYPPTQHDLVQSIPKLVITLGCDDGVICGITPSGDEVFSITVESDPCVRELREQIASATNLRIEAIEIRDGDDIIPDTAILNTSRATYAVLDHAMDLRLRFEEGKSLREMEKAKLLEEAHEQRCNVRHERQELRRKKQEFRWKSRQNWLQQNQDEKLALARLRGFVQRRRIPMVFTDKVDIEQKRDQARLKSMRRRSNFAAKYLRLSKLSTRSQPLRWNYRKSGAPGRGSSGSVELGDETWN